MQLFQQILAQVRNGLRSNNMLRGLQRKLKDVDHKTTSALLQVQAKLDPAEMARKSPRPKIGWMGIVVCGILLLLGEYREGRPSDGRPGTTGWYVYHYERQDLVLPDSSTVRLDSGSTLAYASDFSNKRETYLDGRASFDVKADKDRPFIIHAGRTTIQMLGTRFDVRSDKDGRTSQITLVSGEIKVMIGKSQRVLHPGEQAIIEGMKIRIRKIEHPERSLLWYVGPNLAFDREELDEVIERLARAYHVKVYNPDHIQGIPITGVFLLKDPLDTNLAPIRRIEDYHVRLERRNDTIFLIKPKP